MSLNQRKRKGGAFFGGGRRVARVVVRQPAHGGMVAAQLRHRRNTMGFSGRRLMAPIQMAQHEIKFVDNAATGTIFRLAATPPVGIYLGGPVQGAAPYQRIGQKIANKSLRIRGQVNPNVSNTAGYGIGRIIVVYDEQANGAAAAWADVVSAYTAAGGNSSSGYDGLNMNNRERFKCFVDEQFQLPVTTVVGSLITAGVVLDTTANKKAAPWNFDRFIPLNNLVTHYKGTAGGIGDVATGALLMFVVCDGCTDQSYIFDWSARLRYDDL